MDRHSDRDRNRHRGPQTHRQTGTQTHITRSDALTQTQRHRHRGRHTNRHRDDWSRPTGAKLQGQHTQTSTKTQQRHRHKDTVKRAHTHRATGENSFISFPHIVTKSPGRRQPTLPTKSQILIRTIYSSSIVTQSHLWSLELTGLLRLPLLLRHD